MSEEQPDVSQASVQPPEIALPPVAPERAPFWGYGDVFLVAGLALPCMFLGWVLVRLTIWATHLHAARGVEAVPETLVGYGLLFAALAVIFRVQYDRPLWRSLGWTWKDVPVMACIAGGLGTLLMVGAAARLLQAPPAAGPLVDMMKDRTALIAMALFGTLAAPVAEELAFRGFLQPLLIRDLGAIAGIAVTSALFGGLHYSEYGDSWRSALLLALSGVAFGCVRNWTGSSAAAAVTHATFNGLQFAAVIAAGKGGLH